VGSRVTAEVYRRGRTGTRGCRGGESGAAEAFAPANPAVLHTKKLLEKEQDNAERGRDFRFVWGR
jgi:hypothetical protein